MCKKLSKNFQSNLLMVYIQFKILQLIKTLKHIIMVTMSLYEGLQVLKRFKDTQARINVNLERTRGNAQLTLTRRHRTTARKNTIVLKTFWQSSSDQHWEEARRSSPAEKKATASLTDSMQKRKERYNSHQGIIGDGRSFMKTYNRSQTTH